MRPGGLGFNVSLYKSSEFSCIKIGDVFRSSKPSSQGRVVGSIRIHQVEPLTGSSLQSFDGPELRVPQYAPAVERINSNGRSRCSPGSICAAKCASALIALCHFREPARPFGVTRFVVFWLGMYVFGCRDRRHTEHKQP